MLLANIREQKITKIVSSFSFYLTVYK